MIDTRYHNKDRYFRREFDRREPPEPSSPEYDSYILGKIFRDVIPNVARLSPYLIAKAADAGPLAQFGASFISAYNFMYGKQNLLDKSINALSFLSNTMRLMDNLGLHSIFAEYRTPADLMFLTCALAGNYQVMREGAHNLDMSSKMGNQAESIAKFCSGLSLIALGGYGINGLISDFSNYISSAATVS